MSPSVDLKAQWVGDIMIPVRRSILHPSLLVMIFGTRRNTVLLNGGTHEKIWVATSRIDHFIFKHGNCNGRPDGWCLDG